MFDEYANTEACLRSLVEGLEKRGLQPRYAQRWSRTAVRMVLSNPAYIGTWVFGKVRKGKFNWVGNGGVGGDEVIVIEDSHPALIAKETFVRVQEKLARRACPKTRPRANHYYLSGLLVCGNTGEPMFGHRSSDGFRRQYYATQVQKSCAAEFYSIRKEPLDEFVIGTIAEVLSSPELEANLRAAVARKLKAKEGNCGDAKALKQRIAALDRKIAKGVERLLLLDGEDLTDASAALAGWRKERRELNDQLAGTGGAGSPPERDTAPVLAELADLRETFQTADPAKLRAALRTVVRDITLYWAPGGPRKWRFVRGVIRFGENWLLPNTLLSMPYITSVERIAEEKGGASVLLKQLTKLCGPITDNLEQRVRRLPLPRLEALAEALLEFRSPVDLRAWLDTWESTAP